MTVSRVEWALATTCLALTLLVGCKWGFGVDAKSASEVYEEHVQDMTAQAPALRVGQPIPAWRKALQHSDVDNLVVVPGGRVFACTGRTEEDFRRYHYGPCLLLDGASGNELWRYTRAEDNSNNYSVDTSSLEPPRSKYALMVGK